MAKSEKYDVQAHVYFHPIDKVLNYGFGGITIEFDVAEYCPKKKEYMKFLTGNGNEKITNRAVYAHLLKITCQYSKHLPYAYGWKITLTDDAKWAKLKFAQKAINMAIKLEKNANEHMKKKYYTDQPDGKFAEYVELILDELKVWDVIVQTEDYGAAICNIDDLKDYIEKFEESGGTAVI